eukprot:scaffold199909_cov36-Cyclotella_meneghiniana.AAC.1
MRTRQQQKVVYKNELQRLTEFHSLGDHSPSLLRIFTCTALMLICCMRLKAKEYPKLCVVSVDPGFVYTDLILRMPKYAGKGIEETTVHSPKEGVEAHMRLLFDDNSEACWPSGKLYAMKDGMVV